MNPHSTQKSGRSCVSCHQDSRATGLGAGILSYRNKKWSFTPALSDKPHIAGLTHSLDAFVDINGKTLVYTSRPSLRTLERKEIEKILYVGLCLNCHKDFKDPVMKNWDPSDPPEPCKWMPYK